MKTLITLPYLLLAFIPLGLAQGSGLTAAIAQLPTCSITCLATAVAQSPCQLTNQTCICTNADLQSSVELCVLKSCTVKEGLTTKNVTQTTCGAPIRSRVMSLKVTNITMGVVTAACVLLRIIYKAVFSVAELGWDDYTILATLIVGTPSTILIDRGTIANGLGRDVWSLQFKEITDFGRFFYVVEILYFLELTLLKLGLLLFFLRIFPARPIKRIIWATMIFNTLYGLAFILAGIFQCRPISYYWKRWDGEHEGTCLNINALGWANAAISIALDIWMLALPLWQVMYLKLAWKKKAGVIMMFLVGAFVTVVSILRLQSLVHFANSQNPTWDQFGLSNWSVIEINVGLMCACMPALRVILVRLFPKVLGSSTYSSNQYYAKYGVHSHSAGGGIGNKSGNISSAMGSRIGREQGGRDKNAITYTKTFEVQHGDNDEEQLVHMDDLSAKGTRIRSDNSSEASITVMSPMPISPAVPRS